MAVGIVKALVEFAAYGFAAAVAVLCAIYLWDRLFRCVGCSALWRQTRAVILALLVAATVATIEAQKRGGTTGTTGILPVDSGTTVATGVPPVESTATNTLHLSAIAVPTSGTVALTAAWPENFLDAGQTLDVLASAELQNWAWLTNGVVSTGATNNTWVLENQPPSNCFYKVVVRDSLTDMDDPDGDGLPNVYELAHGRNPWVDDYALVPRLTVGPDGQYATIAAALAASRPYSVVELAVGEYEFSSTVIMPPHPVMVTAPEPYAVVRSAAGVGVFELNAGQTEETLFRNLYVWLGARGGFQAAFWCGGSLPWGGQAASATFEDVYVRMPFPETEYFGWHFYRAGAGRAVMRGCVVNAAGATWANGVYGYDPPPLSLAGCTFLNFPTNRTSAKACGIYLQSSAPNYGGMADGTAVDIFGTLFDASFTNALPLARVECGLAFRVSSGNVMLPAPFADGHVPDVTNDIILAEADVSWTGHPLPFSNLWVRLLGALAPIADGVRDFDGDGRGDYEEIYFLGTDPWLADTDGDGFTDAEEYIAGTDPRDIGSHVMRLAISVTNRVQYADVTNYVFKGSVEDWRTNVLFVTAEVCGATNVDRSVVGGPVALGAFSDLDRDGAFAPGSDVLLTRVIPNPGAVTHVLFDFGDVDGDGADDLSERNTGTDPHSPLSCVVARTVRISDSDSKPYLTNHLWVSSSPLIEDALLHTCSANSFVTNVWAVATNGVLYAIVSRDLNRNGVYDEGIDTLVTKSFARSESTFTVTVGDADGDGVQDSKELAQSTDPFDPANFMFGTHIFFECMDRTPGLTNYVQATIDGGLWDNAQGQAFTGCVSSTIPVSGVTTGGVFYAKYFRDVNRNGVYDEGVDIFASSRFGQVANSAAGGSSGILIGDCDSDGVPDSEELAAGTDPSDRYDCRFNLNLTVGGVFTTSNNLTAVVLLDGLPVTVPAVVFGRAFSCSVADLSPHTWSGVVVRFWDDMNQNGVLDAGETFTDQSIVPDGTNTVVYCRLPLGAFDSDRDGMPDYWEVQNGLSPHDPTDALDDPDGDGLINLHEFWAGCNVWTYDGTGTALYAFCHAIDDRIRVDGSLPVEVYPETQLGWTAQFGTERNENCWAYGIDISGASPWNSSEWGLKAGTAISRRHIIFAHHYQIPPGNTIKFIGTDNSTNIFTIVANKSLAGTDITIGLLSGDLPESVTPSYILPTDYGRFVGDARRLPMLFIDNEENARITDSNALPYQSKDSDGLVPVDAKRRLYFDAVVSGDSGGPKYFVCGNTVILACALHTYGTGASGRGPFVTFYRNRIQAVMDELCPGYTLRVFDMSTFRRLDNED